MKTPRLDLPEYAAENGYVLKTYKVWKGKKEYYATVNDEPLAARNDLRDYSASFAFDVDPTAAKQLALAMLADFLRDDELAVNYHEAFAAHVLRKIRSTRHRFTMPDHALHFELRMLKRRLTGLRPLHGGAWD